MALEQSTDSPLVRCKGGGEMSELWGCASSCEYGSSSRGCGGCNLSYLVCYICVGLFNAGSGYRLMLG